MSRSSAERRTDPELDWVLVALGRPLPDDSPYAEHEVELRRCLVGMGLLPACVEAAS